MSNHASLPFHLYVNIDNKYLGSQMPPGVTKGIWHGIHSRVNQILMCHVLLESGAHWSGIPIQAISVSSNFNYSPNQLMPWACMGEETVAFHIKYLEGISCSTIKTIEEKGRHTGIMVDWKDGFSRYPQEHKPLNLIQLNSGQFILYPNNFILFEDKHFVDNSGKEFLKYYKRNEIVFWGE